MKRLIAILMIVACLFVFAGESYAWDPGGWDQQKISYILKTTAPTVNDSDFSVPYLWVDETGDKFYLLIDNTPGAAVWQEMSSYAGGSPSFATVDLTGVTDTNIPYMQAAGAGFGDSPLNRTDANTILFKSATGQAARLDISADAGEDNSDKWRVQVADGGDVTLQTYTSGVWVTTATWTNSGGLTTTGKVGIGTVAPTTTFAVVGGKSVKKTNVSDADYGTSALTTDYLISFTSLTGARTAIISTEDIQTGTITQPRVMIFKDESGSAGTYPITIVLENAGIIDGQAAYSINQAYGSVMIYLNGVNGFCY